ncbi:hypothetical protein TRIHO_02380 [Tritonibacter horizontis]|uniref:Glycosyl transferase family 2 n=1 Tax=Tritonibacter horizontis TaxID=1768241 RepID=A0A132C2U9_9RHOB|nr:hypothetical protein TRIHO_02380 [Tritonibacter horizontis]
MDNTAQMSRDSRLVVVVLRNEIKRLPSFLAHYRRLGADHFLVVDNSSDDGSAAYLQAEASRGDLSLWQTSDSYRESRFGLDWSGWLLMRYGHGRWCMTVDVDELFVYPGMERHDLRELTDCLDRSGQGGMGALMLDLFPKGPLNQHQEQAQQAPTDLLRWFDAKPYRMVRQAPQGNLWLQGGPRARVFFAETPDQAPTLNKIPLIRWNRRFAYTNSTHAALPRELNALYDGPGGPVPSAVLLHTKFLPEVVEKSPSERKRRQHFHNPDLFDDYYRELAQGPDLWHAEAVHYESPEQLAALGLCRPMDWSASREGTA